MSDGHMKQLESKVKETKTPKKLGPCCVCKETKAIRDQCLFDYSEAECTQFIWKHNECLKQHGFEPAK